MKKLIVVPVAMAVFASSALAGVPSFKVSPTKVQGGNKVTASGVTGSRCGPGKQVTIFSNAFAGATSHKWQGTPAVYAKVASNHKFSASVKISTNVAVGKYKVTARCSTGTLGHAELSVSQFY
jgi:hypothetical protein